MTRKRFVRLLMAEGCSRNRANVLAYLPRNGRMDRFLIVRKLAAAKLLLQLVCRPAAQSEAAHE